MENGRKPDNVGLGEVRHFTFAQPPARLKLASGLEFGPVTIAYETWGRLDRDRANAILIMHALSGDSHAAGFYAGDQKPGWWDPMIGPGKAFDTDKFFVVCANVLGGCRGSTGPSSTNPETGVPYGLSFPVVTISDMVRCHKKLVEHLGVEKLYALAGGSMGGMQVLQWVVEYPGTVRCAIPIATNLKHSPQQIAFDEVGRQAIMADPAWAEGRYYGREKPTRGLAVARMIGHITYMSESSMEQKFGRRLKDKECFGYSFAQEFQVEGYLRYQGDSFVRRFDANSYLYITKAMDYFDLDAEYGADLFRETAGTRFLVISFSSDWLYPPANSQEIVRRLKRWGAGVTYCDITSNYGHDAFLVNRPFEVERQTALVKGFLEAGLDARS